MHSGPGRSVLRRFGEQGGKRPFVQVPLLLGAALFAGTVLAAPAVKEATGGKTIQPAAIYHNYCSVCHGDKADGRSRAQGSLVPPPRDLTTAEARAQLTREYMIAVIRDGKPGTAMVGWKTQLKQAEVEAVVDYIRTVFMLPEPGSPLARGRTIYMQTCAVCHGDRGQGAVWAGGNMPRPPRAFTQPDPVGGLTRSRMIAAVTHGVPGTPMAGFGTQLSAADIETVVSYIDTVFVGPATAQISGTKAHGGKQGETAQEKAPGAAAVDMALPLPKKLAGNAQRGAKFYNANCATCHGVKGDGQGPRAYFIRPKPANFLDPATRSVLNRPAIFAAVSVGKQGTEMPAWNKVIDDQRIADVAEYVFRSFVRPPQNPQTAGRAR